MANSVCDIATEYENQENDMTRSLIAKTAATAAVLAALLGFGATLAQADVDSTGTVVAVATDGGDSDPWD